MKLYDLCREAGIPCPQEMGDREIKGISSDSRRVGTGYLFVCICGIHTDGHDRIGEAVRAGAVCVLCLSGREGEVPDGVAVIGVSDPRVAEAFLWDAWYGHPGRRLSCIGVTGTNGKTGTAHMLKAILEGAGRRCGIIGTLGCRVGDIALASGGADPLSNMTTPDPEVLYRVLAEMLALGADTVVMEVSSHALALGKVVPLRFRGAIFTNLTPEHLDFHQTMEHYAEAKAGLFAASERSVINADSPYAERMLASCACGVRCGITSPDCDYRAVRISCRADGVSYHIEGEGRLSILCPIPGEFTVINSLQAAVLALELGVEPDIVERSLATMSPVKGRMERLALGEDADIGVIIDYAHTPDALERLLITARAICSPDGRVVTLFGCGGDRDRTKRPVMGRIAGELSDLVILTSDNSRSEEPGAVLSEIVAGMPMGASYCILPDRAEAIRYAILEAHAGDLILLCGKGHEEYEIDRRGRRRFSEREIALAAMRERQQKL